MDWQRAVRGLGRGLIAFGVLILLFVAYELWGTGIAESRSQQALRQSLLRSRITTTTTARPQAGAPPTTVPVSTTTTFPDAPPPAPSGEAVAIIRIPKLGVDKAVVQGVALSDLRKGPGHYPTTPMPGQPGNAAIAGHRTTYGAPFFNLNELASGDHIFVTTAQGAFEYRVRETKVVRPSEVSVLDPTKDNRLTLTTCNPRFSASERLVVVSDLIGPAAPAPPPTTVPEQPTTGITTPSPVTTIPAFEGEGAAGNLSGKRSAAWPTLWWGLLAGAIWLAVWVLSKKWRRWPAYAVGAPFFFVVLFVFYENVARLLPANF